MRTEVSNHVLRMSQDGVELNAIGMVTTALARLPHQKCWCFVGGGQAFGAQGYSRGVVPSNPDDVVGKGGGPMEDIGLGNNPR